MGTKINELVSKTRKVISFENLLNKEIAIDAFNTIYQFLAIIRQKDGTPLKDYEGNVTSHLSGLFYRTLNFLEHNIKPIYVFDGKPSELKLDTIRERKKGKKEAREKMVEAQEKEDFEKAMRYAQYSSTLNESMIRESKKLIEYLGITVIQADSEGEAQAAYLVSKGDAWACGSQDYDSLLFGAKRLIRNFAITRTRKVKDTTTSVDIEYISLSKFLEQLNINREQLIEMGILIGTDFYPGIKGIGQHTALDLIKKHGSLENIIRNNITIRNKSIDISLDIVNEIKEIFLKPNVNQNYTKPKWRGINYDKVEELLIEEHNFSSQRVKNALKQIKKQDLSKRQASLDDFFKKN